MRKRIIGQGSPEVLAVEPGWMELERPTQVEITSEDLDDTLGQTFTPINPG